MPKSPEEAEQLINTAYDLALDPSLFERFAVAWDQFTQDMTQDDAELDDGLQAHFERAFMILERMGRDISSTQPLENLIAERDGPCLSVNTEGQILTANNYASQLLGAQLEGLALPQSVHQKSSDSLTRGLLEVQSAHSLLPILVLLEDNVPSLFVLRKLPQSKQILIDITGSVWSPEVSEFLTKTHGLTQAEVEVAKLLYQGLNLQEIADTRHRSKETVRKHLRAVFDKTDCHSQAQLMRLITGINFARIDEPKLAWFSSRINMSNLLLRDGRNLAYYDVGTGDKALVIMHPYLRTPELPEAIEKHLLSKGYRLIGVCRAGFGDSTPLGKNEDVLQKCATDVIELMDTLGINNFSLLGLMGGSINCYAIASHAPKRVSKITIISGTVPIVDDSQVKGMPPSTRAMVFTARRLPKIFPFLIRSAVAMVDMGDEEKLIHSIYGKSPSDWEYATRPEVRDWIVRGAQFTVHHGYATYAREIAAIALLDGNFLAKVSCPTTLIHSPEDIFVTLDSVNTLAKQNELLNVIEVPNSSHLMLFSHTEVLLDLLS